MRYIAEKQDEDFLVTGIKEMETVTGDKVEVKIDSKLYKQDKLEEVIKAYTKERDDMYDNYSNNIEDLLKMLEAINNCK